MIQVKLESIRKAVIEEVEQPKIGIGEALIEVHSVGICGSDMHVYVGQNPVLEPPVVQGHEFGGVIKALGSDKEGLAVGMKVAINPVINCGSCYYCNNDLAFMCEGGQVVIGGEVPGAMTEQIVVPIDNVVPLNDQFDLLYSPFVEPTAVAIHTAGHIKNSTVAVIGLGPIGLLCQEICRINGNRIIGLDISDIALSCSNQLGADLNVNMKEADVADRINRFLAGSKVDCVIDTVCNQSTIQFAIDVVRRCGEIVMVGIPHRNVEVDVINLLLKQIVLKSSYLYSHKDFLQAKELVTSGQIKIKPLLTKVFSMKDAPEAYEFKLTQPSLKVVLTND